MNKYVEDCVCGNPYPHGVEFAGRYQFVCDKCGRKTKWFYERNNARYSWNRKIRYKRNKEKGVSMTTPTKEQIDMQDPCVGCEFADMIIPGSLTTSCFSPCNEKIRFLYRQYNKKDKKQP